MAERPPPESIRGSWYYVDSDVDPRELGDKPPQVLTFKLDGTFTRYIAKRDEWTEKERGDYTFDGAFLIIRGRNTDTFRVRPEAFWRWDLEGKKQSKALLRGLLTPDDFVDLSEADLKEIRILPIRVGIRTPTDNPDAINELIYRGEGGKHRIGTFFVEREGQKAWVGLTPCVEGIAQKTWERIVHESYLDIFLGKPDDVKVVTVRFLHTGDSRVFAYQN